MLEVTNRDEAVIFDTCRIPVLMLEVARSVPVVMFEAFKDVVVVSIA
jgi:hypothetical protein